MDATTFFLTYPQTSFQHEQYLQFLSSIKPIIWARVATEQHQDGHDHIHCIVRFGARVKTRSNLRLFDFMGRHPNIQIPRKIKDVLEYISKGGSYSDHGPVPTSKNIHTELVQHASNGLRDEFDKCAMENRVSFQWAEHLWKRHGTSSKTILEPGQGTECVQLQGLQFSGKSTLVTGPSGTGKSTWAKRIAPKPALWCTHLDDLKCLNKEHKSIIFDDMEFKHLPRTTQIYIVDQDDIRTIHCRNTNATIPANIPKIFTANNYPFIDDDAIRRRLEVHNLISWTI